MPLFEEYTWSRKAQDARATELKWRVKGNIVDTAINFIWLVHLLLDLQRDQLTCRTQGLDAICNCADLIPVLHLSGRRALDSLKGLHFYCPLFAAANSYGRTTWPSVRHVARSASQGVYHNVSVKMPQQPTCLCNALRHFSRRMKSRTGLLRSHPKWLMAMVTDTTINPKSDSRRQFLSGRKRPIMMLRRLASNSVLWILNSPLGS